MALLVALAAMVLSEALFGGRVLLPAGLLRHMLPWSAAVQSPEPPPAWNPLMWDGIAQFYPWRKYAAEWVVRGTFPLWNPHQFCGTPFFANSQSALFYPINALFYLPGPLSTAQRFAWVALLHLSLAGGWTYAWLRALGAGRPGSFLAGAAFMLSGFAVTWLELPTFLSVACWIPLLLLTIHHTLARRSLSWAAGAGLALGLMLLGGHLQIAFYGLLAAGAYALFGAVGTTDDRRRTTDDRRPTTDDQAGEGEASGANRHPSSAIRHPSDASHPSDAGRFAAAPPITDDAACAAPGRRWSVVGGRSSVVRRLSPLLLALGIGFALAAPQVLPAVELSRLSHRASPATRQGYQSYVGYAVPGFHLITLYLPDFFGNPKRGNYMGAGNYAEYAGYTGAATLLLAFLGAVAGWRRHRTAWFLAVLAALTLWMAAGSPLNALLYFGVPGFGQSGSPGRILVLFCLAVAALAGLGLDWILTAVADRGAPMRRTWLSLAAAAGLWTLGFLVTGAVAVTFVTSQMLRPATEVWSASLPALRVTLSLVAMTLGGLAAAAAGLRAGRLSADLAGALMIVLPCLAVAADLFLFATGYLLTAPESVVYPPTALTDRIAAVQRGAPGERVLPVNRRWSLVEPPNAVLPPNAALAYGLNDAQGYDSLYLRRYKALANAIQGGDCSPPQNGNILFLSNYASPLFPLLGVTRVLSRDPLPLPPASDAPVEGVTVFRDPRALPRAFVVHRWSSASDEEALPALEKLAGSGPTALRETAILSGAGSGLPSSELTTAVVMPAAEQATITGATPGYIRVTVKTAAPGLLLLTDNYYPGWRATVAPAGRSVLPEPVLRADHTFRAVRVPVGASQVTLRFEPVSLRIGLFLATLAVAALGAVLAKGIAVLTAQPRDANQFEVE